MGNSAPRDHYGGKSSRSWPGPSRRVGQLVGGFALLSVNQFFLNINFGYTAENNFHDGLERMTQYGRRRKMDKLNLNHYRVSRVAARTKAWRHAGNYAIECPSGR